MSSLLNYLYSIVILINKLNYYICASVYILSVELALVLILRFCQKLNPVFQFTGFDSWSERDLTLPFSHLFDRVASAVT